MLRPAQLYEKELNELYVNSWYDLTYQYYRDNGTYTISLPDNNLETHHFVSVDSNNKIIGYLSYRVSWSALSAYSFGLISFDIGNPIFLSDVKKQIDKLFYDFNMNRIEFNCYADNSAIELYLRFIKRYGGRRCGYYRQCSRLQDGKLHDAVAFEIMKDEYHGRRKLNDEKSKQSA